MLALILIGGKGTRLRPFTCSRPKPVLPLVNRPFLEYQFDLLKRHGIRDVLLCTSGAPGPVRKALGNGRRLGMRVRYAPEARPLGTAGAVKNCAELLEGPTFLVLNGDVLNALDITAFLRAHRRRRADVSISLTRVKDPTAYGLVETDADGKIRDFLEKPSWDEIRVNTINAGAYIFERGVLDHIPPGVAHSLERGLFPHLLAEGFRLFGHVSSGYWIDIGTIDKYLQAHLDLLGGDTPGLSLGGRVAERGRGVRLGRGITWGGKGARAVLGDDSSVGDFARFSGRVCIGPRCVVGKGAQLEDCVVLEDTRVGDGVSLKRCLVGERCRIGANAVVNPGAAVAPGSGIQGFSLL